MASRGCFLLLLLVALTGFAGAQTPITDEQWGFQLQAADGFRQQPPPASFKETRLKLVNGDGEDAAYFYVDVLDLPDQELAALTTDTRNFIVEQMKGTIRTDADATVSGLPAHSFVYEGLSQYINQRRAFTHTILVTPARVYLIHGVVPAAGLSSYLPAFEAMLNSFKVLQ